MSFTSSFEIIDVATPDPNIFLRIAEYVADAAGVNPNGIKTLLANGLKASQFLVTVLKIYLKTLLVVVFYAIEFLVILH